jgi:hypothetical protein
MSLESSDIHGTTGANFTFTLSSATIVQAVLEVTGKPNVTLTVSADGHEVTVPSLPADQSFVRLALVWAPGDDDAVIDVGTVISGTAIAADPKHTIDAGDTPGFVELFGGNAQ